MSASPEFYKPAAPAAFTSPCASPLQAAGFGAAADADCYSCRTPTGSGITYLREPTTCPPAPRKPPPPPPVCKKRLFHHQQQKQDREPLGLISVRLDELERIFRPVPAPPSAKRRSLRHKNLPPAAAAAAAAAAQNTCATTTTTLGTTNSSS